MIPRSTFARVTADSDSDRVTLTTAPAGPQVRVQIFRRDVGIYYRIDDLAAMWKRKRWTVLGYLSRMRKSSRPPTREQVKRIGPNSAIRYVEIRDDYAALMRAVFIDRTIRL